MSVWLGRVDQFPDTKPSVFMLLDDHLPSEYIQLIGAGCEEEGVPLCWDYQQGVAFSLAQGASRRSRLEVGIGVDNASICVALLKVPMAPYVTLDGYTHENLRWIGQTAARLSKGQPIPKKESHFDQ